MAITVKFFARLREELQREQQQLQCSGIDTAHDVWCNATGQDTLPENVFCAINQQHAKAQSAVQDGDEVAFFPRITGG